MRSSDASAAETAAEGAPAELYRFDNLTYYAEDGSCLVHIEGSRLGFFETNWLERRRIQRHLYETSWADARLEPQGDHGGARSGRPSVRMLLIGERETRTYETATGIQSSIHLWPGSRLIIAYVLQMRRGVASMRGLAVSEAALALVRVLIGQSKLPAASAVWLLTPGIQVAGNAAQSNKGVLPPSHDYTRTHHTHTRTHPHTFTPFPSATGPTTFDGAGLWGLARTARQEAPSLPLHSVDASGRLRELLPHLLSCPHEPEMALGDGVWRVPRLVRLSPSVAAGSQHLRLTMSSRGAIANLRSQRMATAARTLAAGEAEVEVRAVGLNFRDVLNVLGEYPGDPGPPGLDCSGVTSAFGEHVRHLGPALGATCFGFAFGSLASSARTDAGLLVRKPPHLSHEEACSLPITFSTVQNSPTLSHAHARLQCTHAQRGTLDPTMRISCC